MACLLKVPEFDYSKSISLTTVIVIIWVWMLFCVIFLILFPCDLAFLSIFTLSVHLDISWNTDHFGSKKCAHTHPGDLVIPHKQNNSWGWSCSACFFHFFFFIYFLCEDYKWNVRELWCTENRRGEEIVGLNAGHLLWHCQADKPSVSSRLELRTCTKH